GLHIPVTPQAISGGKNLPHFYFRYKPEIKYYKSHENGRERFSIRGDGQYIVAPPSILHSGGTYKWATGLRIHQVELADPPEWVLELIKNGASPKRDYAAALSEGIPESRRNDFLFSYGCRLISRGIKMEEISEILRSLNKTSFNSPLPDKEVQETITSIAKYREGSEEPGEETEEVPWPSPLPKTAYHGLAGDIVKAIEPHTESDPAAILTEFLSCFGNIIGSQAHFKIEADEHAMRINIVLVGDTAKARKGTSWGQIRGLYKRIDKTWVGQYRQRAIFGGGAYMERT
ncbi:MAG: primase C-terminal domain-containing protein, partial [Thermodesulfobacteriota bacterium]